MSKQKRIRDYGVEIGKLNSGPLNSITDVDGVTVGHQTLSHHDMQTGVTAVIPHQGNLFREKLIASSHVINGYGKTIGTIQLNELGTIETPIILTNTLNVGTASNALIDYMLKANPEIGRTTGTINPIVAECNDMFLNDVRARHVSNEDVWQAIQNASKNVTEGAVGAGTGMLCYSMKGGIGTASRTITYDHGTYTIGVLVLTNFGLMEDFRVNGKTIGKKLKNAIGEDQKLEDKGSVIVIVGTDLPTSERQLNRILKRTVTGLSRTGSIITTGSGEIVMGFSTANKIPHERPNNNLLIQTIHESDMDLAFRAVGEATEEAVLNSLITATSITGRNGNTRPVLKDLIKEYRISLI
ncbi:DmpA family aminopeptidase [Aquibacillus kalidii]|uniref:DmpA family aminopeptidase n=1 Tax=Aquibacillus kalidii TaxID=2762597 RepID=UPI001647461F|nr:P1 family peptidase [Aquibacillus kalidii]